MGPIHQGPFTGVQTLGSGSMALKEAWTQMEKHINSPGGKPWARVKGPMGAVYMHLKEIGWHVAVNEQDQLVGLKDQEGSLWKFNTAIS